MSVRVAKQSAASVYTPAANHVNLYQDSADSVLKYKSSNGASSVLGGAAGVSTDTVDALEGAETAIDADNVVVSADDLTAALTSYATTAALSPVSALAGLLLNLGTTDPSAASGVAATAPRIGVRLNGAATELWLKMSAPNTGWTKL
jgi:hypothetical protein